MMASWHEEDGGASGSGVGCWCLKTRRCPQVTISHFGTYGIDEGAIGTLIFTLNGRYSLQIIGDQLRSVRLEQSPSGTADR